MEWTNMVMGSNEDQQGDVDFHTLLRVVWSKL